MARTVEQVKFSVPKMPKLVNVAAYARVSSGKDAMLHSLSAQVSYYSDKIQKHPGWRFCGVFADEAITGTRDSREQFQTLLAKCRNGEINLILTKSISRFARNTVTLLETVRELRDLGVDVLFEEQNIHTMSAEGELMLTILAGYAQEESRSASENIKWRIRSNFQEGMPWNSTLLGYRYENGVYQIVTEEAEIVRYIYSAFLDGMGGQRIANELNRRGVPTRKGSKWHKNSVMKILQNYTYTGNLILQTTYIKDHITKEACINHGELPKYNVEEAHEPIVSMEQFQAVQAEIKKRTEKHNHSTGVLQTYPFSGMLHCERCGKNYSRKKTAKGYVWICSTFNKQGKAACPSKQIPECTVEELASDVLGISVFNPQIFREQVSGVLVCDGCKLVFSLADGRMETRTWQVRSRKDSWTAEMKENARKRSIEYGEKDHSHPADNQSENTSPE